MKICVQKLYLTIIKRIQGVSYSLQRSHADKMNDAPIWPLSVRIAIEKLYIHALLAKVWLDTRGSP